MKFLILFLFASSLSAQSFFIEDNPKGRIWDYFTSIDLNFDAEIYDEEFFNSLGVSMEYAYEVESSYRDGFFSRVDRYKTKVILKPGDMIPGISSPLYLNLSKESDITFIRQFKKKWNAVKAKPYTPVRLPFNAKRALKSLAPGDFVAIPSQMSFVVGAGFNWGSEETGRMNTSSYYLFQGQFLIHVFRLKDNKVRLKLIATKLREGGARVNLGLNLFGFEASNGIIKKLTRFRLTDFNLGKGKGAQILLDYIFDLTDPDAAKAYDKILSSRNRFKDLSLVIDNVRNYDIEGRLHSTFLLAESLARQDVDKPKQRVKQLFKGVNRFKKSFRSIKMGLPFIDYQFEKLFVKNQIVYESEQGVKTNYYFPFATKARKKKFLRGPFKTEEENRRVLFGLAETENERSVIPYEIGFSSQYSDDRLKPKEQERHLNFLKFQLPKAIRQKIDWGKWLKVSTKNDIKIYYQVILQSPFLEDVKKMPLKKFKESFVNYIYKRNLESIQGDKFLFTKLRLRSFAKKLHKTILATNSEARSSLDKIFSLRNKNLFYKYGFGFLISLIPERELDQFVSIKLDIVAPKKKALNFRYGDQIWDKLYTQLRSLLAVIDNRDYDLRITTTSEHLDFVNK